MRRFTWILPFLFVSLMAFADDKAELQSLHAAVNVLNQEQQAVYQQFQMLQELRRANDRAFYSSRLRPSQYVAEVPNYSDVIQVQTDMVRRGDELARQAEHLYGQFTEIGARKSLLQQRILELTLPK